MNLRIGFIGTGQFARFLTAALVRDRAAPSIILPPRNAAIAAELAVAHDARVAKSNAAVVDASDIVLLTTRAEHGVAPVEGLPWRADQTAVSLVGGLALADLAAAVAPATAVKAMTSYAAAQVPCPFLIYPENPAARVLGERFGAVHALADERAFEAAAAMPVFFALLLNLLGEGEGWCVDHGVSPEIARAQTLAGLRGLAALAEETGGGALAPLLTGMATPGGLTEGGLDDLRRHDSMAPWRAAMDRILARALGEK
ncbi:MAG: NAD(P)-binding domain-containing protein [Proteobacteria bacterium]|nr:NAD(P)-binding domain-containing protein [Pseudomonadota bacterium]